MKEKKLPDDANDIIERVSSRLAQKFRFGYHTIDDMKQQAALFAWEGIYDSWDDSRPLENFLWIHVRNRLYNFKRNNYGRPEKPCEYTKHLAECGTEYETTICYMEYPEEGGCVKRQRQEMRKRYDLTTKRSGTYSVKTEETCNECGCSWESWT